MLRRAKDRNITSIPHWLWEWASSEDAAECDCGTAHRGPVAPQSSRFDAISFKFFHRNFTRDHEHNERVRDALLEAVERGELEVDPPEGEVLTPEQQNVLAQLLDSLVPENG